MKKCSQVLAPDLLTHLHLYAHECTDRRKTEKKGSLGACWMMWLFASFGESKNPMPYNQKFMSASKQGCVFCVQGRAVGCSFLALLSLI